MCASIIASLAHDVGHPGFNNHFFIKSTSYLAVLYNDYSVLEMMHSSITFELMYDSKRNIFQNLTADEKLKVRKLIIDMILATDMSRHFGIVKAFQESNRAPEAEPFSENLKADLLKLAIKCADIAHAAKSLDLHE